MRQQISFASTPDHCWRQARQRARNENKVGYHDRIARRRHVATDHQGGLFRRLVLNDAPAESSGDIDGRILLELGAGNGNFIPQLLHFGPGSIAASKCSHRGSFLGAENSICIAMNSP